MTRVYRGILLAAGILVASAGSANAQAIGSIFGKVTDPSGSVLPGVTVTVTGPALQRPLSATTSTSGTYQFPSVPIGTFTVTFELSGFKKATRANVVITTNFNAPIDQKMEIGQVSEELTVTAAAPVVDTKKTTTGATFTKDILENIPTARDPWQIIGMTPGVQAGLNVGGSASGQQVGLSVYGTSSNVQWNLEGGSITDLSSNSSPSYFNFDSFEQIQVTTGGGDVSVQSSGLSINLVSKSGSNVFKGTAVATFENDNMQANNVSPALFYSGSTGIVSGNPIQRIGVYSVEYGGPIMRNRLWWWAAADKQDINAGIVNFFDPSLGPYCQQLVAAQRASQSQLAGIATYDKLDDIKGCLTNDKTVIKDLEWKFNYQLNSANKIQWLFTSDNKYRNHRGASSTTAIEASTQQTSDAPWHLPLPTHSLTHTLILTDKLVFNNQFTYVGGGFFLDYQDVPPQGSCGQSRYLGSADINDYARESSCLWNQQALRNQTTGFQQRSFLSTYQTVRKSWEAKTDGTYFLTNKLGGDHSLKFGVGWRKNPILSFSHYSGGGRATMQCIGNNTRNCGDGSYVAPGSTVGVVPRSAVLFRDQLLNNDWWTYNGYIQDGYSRGRLRIQGGLRYDWQTSKYLGGCVPANVLRPDLLPSQCEGETDQSTVLDPDTGQPIKDANGNNVMEKIPAFSVWAPRVSATYDLFGNGKTSVHASYSLYYQTKITLANNLGGLSTVTSLQWGNNQSNGRCSTTAGAPCWTDANRDGLIQVDELIGTPILPANSRFDLNTGVLTAAGNAVSKDAKLARTREFITGVQHELIPNLAVGVDYVYRNYDQGTAAYTAGYQPGSAKFPLSQIYTGPITYTDPVTGLTAPYYQICQGCQRPSGIGAVTVTALGYNTYQAVIPTLNKRFSNRWQMNASATFQTNPGYQPLGSYVNPTGVEFTDGRSTIPRYLIKVSGTYALAWGITASGNLNVNQGANRALTIDGPGTVYGGVNSSGASTTIGGTGSSYDNLAFQPTGTTRFGATKLLDLGAQKVFTFRGGKNRLKVMFDAFNVFNVNTITGYTSNNLSSVNSYAPNAIIPPRVFRVGAQIVF